MKSKSMLDKLLDLAKQENELNRHTHSEEYNKLYDELNKKIKIANELEKQADCPLDIRMQISFGTSVYIFVNLDMSRQSCITTYRGDEVWKLTGDRILTKVTVLSDDLKRPSFEVSMPSFSTPCEKYERHHRILLWKDFNKTWWLSGDWWYKKDTKDWQKW